MQCRFRNLAFQFFVVVFVSFSSTRMFETTGTDYDSTSTDEVGTFCTTKGSLHELAVDMFRYSSPPGSASYNKFINVLHANSDFYIDMSGGHGIFSQTQVMMDMMLYGYGLHRIVTKPLGLSNVTLVETLFTSSSCALNEAVCKGQARIFIQTEQYFRSPILWCHEAPNCVILEFSDYNLAKARNHDSIKDLADSIILLPVMTQSPGRLSMYENVVPLWSRSIDVVFLGAITKRRQALVESSNVYAAAHLDRLVRVGQEFNVVSIGRQYSEAKVCLVAHSYSANSGGEYHRLSEMAPFGCIPVMERFSDKIGIDIYEKCAGVVFDNMTNLFETADKVLAKIDEGYYDDRINATVDWWKAGIHWGIILQTVYGEKLYQSSLSLSLDDAH